MIGESYSEYVKRARFHEQMRKAYDYDPVWGLLKPPSTLPDPRDFPALIAPAPSPSRARPRTHTRAFSRLAGGHES